MYFLYVSMWWYLSITPILPVFLELAPDMGWEGGSGLMLGVCDVIGEWKWRDVVWDHLERRYHYFGV